MTLIVIALFLPISVAYPQDSKDAVRKDISIGNTTLKDFIEHVANEFGCSYYIVDKSIEMSEISISMKNATLDEVLRRALEGKAVNYVVRNGNITLSKKIPAKVQAPEKNRYRTKVFVTDVQAGPLTGATVRVDNSGIYAITDDNGYCEIETSSGKVLNVLYTGYLPKTINITGKPQYTIVLEEDRRMLEEVIVVGYGTQRKGNLTGAISSIKSEEITTAPVSNVTNTLGGRLPGLRTKQLSGIPGSDGSSLSIRGFDAPLVIVDGVETSFTNIDPSQIESISILKDGAASIYGSRAGNGVVLVTLKRGYESKTTVSLNMSATLQNSTRLIKSGSSGQRAEWEREAHINANKPVSQIPWTISQIRKFYAGDDPGYLNTNWFNEAIRSWAPQQNHNLSVRGGNDKIRYYSYASYNNQQTISRYDGGAYNRFNLTSNVDATIMQGMELATSINYILENRDFTAENLAGSNYYFALYDSDPRYPLYLPERERLSYAGSSYGNALFVSSRKLAGYSRSANHSLRTNAALTYDLPWVKGLQFKAFINYNVNYAISKLFRKQPDFYTYDAASGAYKYERKSQDPSMIAYGTSTLSDLTQQYSVSYRNSFLEDHNVSVLALFESIDYKNEGFNTDRGNLASSVIDQLFAGDPETASNKAQASEMGRASFVARMNYNYKHKYLVESIFRADASARFAPKGRWGFFPSISLGWVVSEEKFMQSADRLDFLKLRTSFGKSGDDSIGNYQYYSGYAFDMSYIFDGTIYQGLYSTGLANPLLSWERLSIYNAGLDYSFFSRKLYGTIEGFYRLKEGIPGHRVNSLPSTFGTNLPLENLNSTDTRGFEFHIGTAGNIGYLKYGVSGNISWSRSKWVSFDEPDYKDPDQKRIYGHTGKWIDERLGYVSDGLFTSTDEIASLTYVYEDLGGNEFIRPGDVKYKDLNNDGKLNWRDQKTIGQGAMPNWMYGFDLNLSYLGFDFAAFFQGAFGYTSYIDLETAPTELKFKNRWTEEKNDKWALVPRPGSQNTANNFYSDYRNHNASYIRLKSLSLGYSISDGLLKKIKLSRFRVHLAGMNLFTISNISKLGVDPEAPEGTPAYYYPQQRTVSIGISITY